MRKGDFFTKPEKRQIWLNSKGICQWKDCGQPIASMEEAQFHHVKPVADKGSVHDVKNGILLHAKCHTKHFEELHGKKWNYVRTKYSKKARYNYYASMKPKRLKPEEKLDG
jgi:hypothetical protein